jgi:hypothetical protein
MRIHNLLIIDCRGVHLSIYDMCRSRRLGEPRAK